VLFHKAGRTTTFGAMAEEYEVMSGITGAKHDRVWCFVRVCKPFKRYVRCCFSIPGKLSRKSIMICEPVKAGHDD
jgi:hypothetical protein